MRNKIPDFLLCTPAQAHDAAKRGTLRPSYIEKGIGYLSDMITTGYLNVGQESGKGFFQKLDPRVKVIFLIFFVVIVSLKTDILSETAITLFTFLLVVASRINLAQFYKKIAGLTFLFGFLVVFPSAFNVVTPGEMILPVVHLSHTYEFLIYHIPEEIGLTRQGLDGVMMLCLRMMNSLAISFLVIYTTPFHRVIKALQVFRVPQALLLVITLSYRYIFIFAKTVESMYLARKSRLVGMGDDEARIWVAGRIAHMFRKSMSRYEAVFRAMVARGFAEEVRLSDLGELTATDRLSGGSFLLAGIFLLWM
ncbi:MAG TPA: cobalt ECF transporter T component CbiQ [Syntrophales bacterium]